MQIAKVYVNELEAQTIYGKKITKGLRGGRVSLEYAGGIWEGLTKNVAFTNGLKTAGIFGAGLEVEIPPEVTDTAGVEIRVGVCGVDGTGVVIPTVWASLGEVLEAVPSDFEEADKELTPSVAEQILSLIGPMDQLGTEAQDSLVAAINEVIKLAGGDIDPEVIAAAVTEYLAANPSQETDPTVPAWAKQPTKPEYTAEEVGAQVADCVVNFSQVDGEWTANKTFEEVKAAHNAGHTLVGMYRGKRFDFYSDGGGEGFGFIFRVITNLLYEMIWLWEGDSIQFSNGVIHVNYPVTSVNGKTGAVTLAAEDVGALPVGTTIPTDDHINQLINTALGVIENGTY